MFEFSLVQCSTACGDWPSDRACSSATLIALSHPISSIPGGRRESQATACSSTRAKRLSLTHMLRTPSAQPSSSFGDNGRYQGWPAAALGILCAPPVPHGAFKPCANVKTTLAAHSLVHREVAAEAFLAGQDPAQGSAGTIPAGQLPVSGQSPSLAGSSHSFPGAFGARQSSRIDWAHSDVAPLTPGDSSFSWGTADGIAELLAGRRGCIGWTAVQIWTQAPVLGRVAKSQNEPSCHKSYPVRRRIKSEQHNDR